MHESVAVSKLASSTAVIHVPQTLPSSSVGLLCERYKTARLRALKETPQAFSSTYHREAEYDDAIWVQRLRNPLSKTFVALRTERRGGTETSDIELLAANEWLGMIVIFGPRALPADGSGSKTPWKPFLSSVNLNEPPDPTAIVGYEAAYVAFSMFVLIDARRQGLGRSLVQASIETVRAEADSMHATRANIGLFVEAKNQAAQRLYKGCGFIFLQGDSSLNGVEINQVAMGKIVELPGGDSA
ncbi:acetyltransferase [Histoplasma ohiense]|nr:acetyltransferase [Histoplasma ohiense (nom. inval.)]